VPLYGVQYLLRRISEEPSLEEKLTGVDEDKRKFIQEVTNKMAYTNLTPKIPKLIVESAGVTALKTGIGYVLGYGLAKLL